MFQAVGILIGTIGFYAVMLALFTMEGRGRRLCIVWGSVLAVAGIAMAPRGL